MGFWLEPPREGGSRPLPFPDDLKKRGAAEFSLLDSILESLQYLKACKVGLGKTQGKNKTSPWPRVKNGHQREVV